MKLHNTLTNSQESLRFSDHGVVTLYSCGPTLYDHAHIGNLRTFILDDILRRAINYSEYELQAVMNLTDVDDKTIARSQSEHSDLGPMEALLETTRHYEDLFIADLEQVGVDTSLVTLVRATESISQMQAMIAEIARHGLAYISDGSVYFDLAKYQEQGNSYGRLLKIDFKPKSRVDNDEYDKNEASDFALWKAAKDGEPFWDFQLGLDDLPGRPGWHIECSAMATANLGQPVSVHSGGIDLKFPHHENEIAQVVGSTNEDFAQIFVHHNHLLVDGRKMSKSLNNFYTLADIVSKGYDPLVFRLLVLQAHYSSELNFTWDSLEAAKSALLNLYAWADLVHQSESSISLEASQGIIEALGSNLDTPRAMALVHELSAEIPSYELLVRLDQLLGLGLSTRLDIGDVEKALLAQRQQARANKDFTLADELRAKLLELGIEVDDLPAGMRWRRAFI